ncbi:MAG: Methylase of polypeptide chain release factor [Oscillospiraceae bacterium]|nr:Methylase of polypeptide chain release factor [Oscillospiraceae bacterium]
MASTYNNLYLDLRQKLREVGVEEAQLEARELVCFATGKTRDEFYRDRTLYAALEVEERLEEITRRRLSGEPVAYILGEWEFYGMPLDISPEVLIPRSDTEVLAERAIAVAKEAGTDIRVLDLCAGSGCIGLAVAAHVPSTRVVLADVSEGALRICRQNIRRNSLAGRVTAVAADALEKPVSAMGEFQLIVCNPPYIATRDIDGLDVSVRDYEPHLALDGGADGLEFYRAVAKKWDKALCKGGTLLFEVGQGQVGDVEKILLEHGYESIQTQRDTAQIWRVVEGVCNH